LEKKGTLASCFIKEKKNFMTARKSQIISKLAKSLFLQAARNFCIENISETWKN